MISVSQIITWIIVGLLAGSLVGLFVKGDRKGFGLWQNLGIGLAGALIGGLLFWVFDLLPGFANIAISLRDVVSAVIGALIVLAGLWYYQKQQG